MRGEYVNCPRCGEKAVLASGYLSFGGPEDITVLHKSCATRWISPWIPADPDGLPPETYPFWRRQEQARRENT